MKMTHMKRVTIVADDTLESQIVKDVRALGATGFTYTIVHGEGAKGARPSHWEGPNARIEVITTDNVAQRIVEHMASTYFAHYAVIIFTDDVEVVRPEKFGA